MTTKLEGMGVKSLVFVLLVEKLFAASLRERERERERGRVKKEKVNILLHKKNALISFIRN